MNLLYAEDGRLRSGGRFLISVLVVFAANLLASVLADSSSSTRVGEAIYRTTLMLSLLAGFSVLLWTLDRVEGNPLPAMGLRARRWWRESLHGLLLGFTMVSVAVLQIALFLHLGLRLGNARRMLPLALVELVILATGAMAEELVFRGYPFQRLVEGLKPLGAIAVLSATFGVLHLGNPHASIVAVFNTIAIGVVLAVCYLRTGALWFPWGLHLGWNLTLGMIFGLPVSGITEFSVVVRGTAAGPQWLTGGSYGIEGGALGTAAILLGFAYVARFAKVGDHEPEQAAVSPTHQPGPRSIQPSQVP